MKLRITPMGFAAIYALLMPVGLGVIALWVPLHIYMRTASAEVWAAWVQAIGTVGAVAFSGFALWRQGEERRRAQAEERGELKTSSIELAREAVWAIRHLHDEALNGDGLVMETRTIPGANLTIGVRTPAVDNIAARFDRFPATGYGAGAFARRFWNVRSMLDMAIRRREQAAAQVANRARPIREIKALEELARNAEVALGQLEVSASLSEKPAALFEVVASGSFGQPPRASDGN